MATKLQDKMSVDEQTSSYKDAVKALLKYHVDQSPHVPELLEKSRRFFTRCGHELEELNELNAIHVTGTKGKGSVSAMCESILRRYNLKTGLLISPHLIELRERIQINGRPLTKDKYTKYFWECLKNLESSKTDDKDMPSYYRFFTFMAFHVFLCEKVDVAVIEVGKGGAYDTTNILINPVACGITLMDLDHTDVLGDTIEKITWHKAGICKPDSPMVIFPQKPGPLGVIVKRAREIGVSSLEITPPLGEYYPEKITIGLGGEHNKLNASLAVQLCKKWLTVKGVWDSGETLDSPPSEGMKLNKENRIPHENGTVLTQSGECSKQEDTTNSVPFAQPFELPKEFLKGLEHCRWPGRSQIEKKTRITFYIDAAHTPQSVATCAKWFEEEADKEVKDFKSHSKVVRVLLFNFLGCRDPKALLTPLLNCGFDFAVFAPSFTGVDGTTPLEQYNPTNNPEKLYERSQNDEEIWQELYSKHSNPSPAQNGLANHSFPQDKPQVTCKAVQTKTFRSIDYAIQWISGGRGLEVKSTCDDKLAELEPTLDELKNADHVQVLVTGSARLIGITMFVLDIPVFTENTQ